MHIYLLRHGIAVDPGTGGCKRDAERALTPEGRQKLLHAAAALKALEISPDLILSSPYVRAHQTAKLIARQLGLGRKQLQLTEHLQPGGSFNSLIREIGQLRALPSALLLVGHEPDLSLVASHLVAGSAKMRIDLKKAGLVALDAASLGPGAAVLRFILTPRQMRLIAAAGSAG
jgi:phosphohistidine phosphatase